MKPIEFQGPGRAVIFGKDQPGYNVLPARVQHNGRVLSRWSLTFDERQAILDGACIELSQMTFGQPLQPVHLHVQGAECGAADMADAHDERKEQA